MTGGLSYDTTYSQKTQAQPNLRTSSRSRLRSRMGIVRDTSDIRIKSYYLILRISLSGFILISHISSIFRQARLYFLYSCVQTIKGYHSKFWNAIVDDCIELADGSRFPNYLSHGWRSFICCLTSCHEKPGPSLAASAINSDLYCSNSSASSV